MPSAFVGCKNGRLHHQALWVVIALRFPGLLCILCWTELNSQSSTRTLGIAQTQPLTRSCETGVDLYMRKQLVRFIYVQHILYIYIHTFVYTSVYRYVHMHASTQICIPTCIYDVSTSIIYLAAAEDPICTRVRRLFCERGPP